MDKPRTTVMEVEGGETLEQGKTKNCAFTVANQNGVRGEFR